MEKRTLGKTGMAVSVLGFGGSEIGYQSVALKTVEKILNGALDAGINLIDTAACYGDSEELIGKAVSARRAQFFLTTKCGHASGIRLPDWSEALIPRSIDRSLKRLRTDHLAVLQLHSCSEEVLREGAVVEALRRAREAGKTRFLGYSGDGADARYAVECGVFDTLQISVSIADQEAIDLVLPKAIERGMGVIAKRPIANAAWLSDKGARDFYSRPYYERLQKLGYKFLGLAPQESVKSALRFTLSVPGVHAAIVGTTKPERVRPNIAMIKEAGALPKGEYQAIRARWREIAEPGWRGQT
jgi:aryl-alcohol dehydrogenase-like predicted oxidoreductase